MECFIKKIFIDRIDEQTHRQFVRFGKGTFSGRAALNLQKSTSIRLRGSFEFVNDFSLLAAELSDAKFSGIVLSKKEIPELSRFPEKKKPGIFEYDIYEINSEIIKAIQDKVYYMLLDAEAEGILLKMKKKLPKISKSGELKIDDKFCILEADLKYWEKIKDFFMLPDCKKAKISHTYIIEEIIMPENEKDFERIRELARRKGRIIRSLEIEGQKKQEERGFEV